MIKVCLLATVLGGLMLFTSGCVTDQATINAAAGVVQQGAYVGAAYAIQQNTNNVKYFVLADISLKKFALGSDTSPTAFETALNEVAPQLNNQWIQLGIDSVVVIYDAAYSQYVVGQVTNNAVAKQFITAVDTGFVRAIQPYLPAGTTLRLVRVVKVERPTLVAPKFK